MSSAKVERVDGWWGLSVLEVLCLFCLTLSMFSVKVMKKAVLNRGKKKWGDGYCFFFSFSHHIG